MTYLCAGQGASAALPRPLWWWPAKVTVSTPGGPHRPRVTPNPAWPHPRSAPGRERGAQVPSTHTAGSRTHPPQESWAGPSAQETGPEVPAASRAPRPAAPPGVRGTGPQPSREHRLPGPRSATAHVGTIPHMAGCSHPEFQRGRSRVGEAGRSPGARVPHSFRLGPRSTVLVVTAWPVPRTITAASSLWGPPLRRPRSWRPPLPLPSWIPPQAMRPPFPAWPAARLTHYPSCKWRQEMRRAVPGLPGHPCARWEGTSPSLWQLPPARATDHNGERMAHARAVPAHSSAGLRGHRDTVSATHCKRHGRTYGGLLSGQAGCTSRKPRGEEVDPLLQTSSPRQQ